MPQILQVLRVLHLAKFWMWKMSQGLVYCTDPSSADGQEDIVISDGTLLPSCTSLVSLIYFLFPETLPHFFLVQEQRLFQSFFLPDQ